MKKVMLLGTLLLAAGIALIARYGAADTASTHAGQSLPASLDDLYPPKAQRATYLMAMHELNMPLSGFVCDLFENDINNAYLNLERFKAQYQRVAGLVPEWVDEYPEAPLDELATALESGHQGTVMDALDQIDMVCHGCHIRYMPAVHFKYHWDDFHSISATDPLTSEPVSFKRFKQMINTDLTGIGNDLEQGQVESARKHGQDLALRFEAMKDICVMCHDSERKYYVSDDIRGIVDTLRTVLNEVPVNRARIGELVQGIGTESCFKCHLVHVPAAYSKY